MADTDKEQKTEHPTEKRLGEARERGQLPVSREVSACVLLVGILLVVGFLGPPMMAHLVTYLQVFIAMPDAVSLNISGLQALFLQIMEHVGLATGLIFAVMLTVAVLGTMLQTGFFASLDLIAPKWGRLSPIRGLGRLFSPMGLVELLKSMGKMMILGTVVYFVLKPVFDELTLFAGRDLIANMIFMHHEAVYLIIKLVAVFAVMAFLDLLYQRWHYFKSLRMTKVEVKDEYKQVEGDPKIKARLRHLRMEKARKRMMAQVPKADVVITNPTHYAVALKYDNKKMAAPVVVAKGINLIADKIREIANENKIPLVSNPPLARALYDTVDLDREIPTQHYRAVAEIISYVYKLKKRKF